VEGDDYDYDDYHRVTWIDDAIAHETDLVDNDDLDRDLGTRLVPEIDSGLRDYYYYYYYYYCYDACDDHDLGYYP
jgi:hypothetical protein